MTATVKEKAAAFTAMTWRFYPGPVVAVVLLVLIAFLVAVQSWLPHKGFVQELTVGGGMIADADKLRDLRLAPVAIGIQLALLAVLTLGQFNLSRIGTIAFWLLAGGLPLHLLWVLPSNMPLLLFCSLGLAAAAAYHLSRSYWQETSGQFILAAAGAALASHHLFGASPYWAFVVSLPLAASLALLAGPAAALWAGSAGSIVVALVVGLSAPFFWFDGPGTSISLLDGIHALLALAVLVEAARALHLSLIHI